MWIAMETTIGVFTWPSVSVGVFPSHGVSPVAVVTVVYVGNILELVSTSHRGRCPVLVTITTVPRWNLSVGIIVSKKSE